MAENKRTYTITISGLTESYENVKSLREALDSLSDTVINVSNEEQKTSETRKSTASSTDALAKAQEKLNNYDRQYQEELAKVNAELSANKKEINDALKLQQAQDVVDAKQLDTYAQKQQYLSALNTLIRNHSTATEEDTQAIDRMVQESAALQAELKATDEQMKIYVRNVGNYQGAADTLIDSHKSIKQELKDLKGEMADMLANGVSKTDAAYLQLAERAGHLKDAISDANEDITNFASDTRGMTNAINLAQSAVGAYQLYNSTMELFGQGNEDAAESMKKMMAVMTVLNSLQQVQNSLLENGSATARLYNKAVELVQAALGIKKAAVEEDIAVTEASTVAEEANTVANELNATASETNAASTGTATTAEATNTTTTTSNTVAKEANTVATNKMSLAQKAGAVASNILSVALRAIPLMAIIGLVMALIQNWESIWNWFKKTFPVLDTLSNKFNKFGGFMKTVKAIAKGLGEGIINWLVNPFKTLGNVIGKILKGDFEGAAKAAIDGVKQQFKGFSDSINKELNDAAISATEERVKKQKEKEHELTEYQLQELMARKGNEAKYSKEGIALQQKEFAQRKALAKGNADELKKIHLEEVSFYRECEEQKTKASEKGAKARAAAATKAANEAKKAAEQAQKEYDELSKTMKKDIEDLDKLSDATTKKIYKRLDEEAKNEQKLLAKQAQSALEYWQSKSMEVDKYAKKMNEVNRLAYEAELEGSENEAALLTGFAKKIYSEIGLITNAMNEAESLYGEFTDRIVMLTAKRSEMAVNNAAVEANELRKQYDAAIAKAEQDLEKLKKNSKSTQQEIQDAQDALDRARKAKLKEFDDYAQTLEVVIPVDFDLDNLKRRFDEIKPDFAFTDIVNVISGVNGALENLYKRAEQSGKVFETFRDLGNILGMARGETEDELDMLGDFLKLATDTRPFKEKADEMQAILSQGTINISKFGNYSKTASDGIKAVVDDTVKAINDEYKAFVSQQDKFISYHEKTIRKFQDATKDIKFEPVMEDDELSKFISGQILNMDKTKERYDSLKSAYEAYQKTLKKGSEEREAYEEAWQQKLAATQRNTLLLKQIYGENSNEYKNAHMEYMLLLDEKAKGDKAYELEYEKVTQQIEEIDKKSSKIREEYFESLHKRMSEIYSALNDNVFGPIADGFGALLDFQLEEAKEALDEITDLYDKAVDAREQSAERMKEINDELRNDDGANKEALQQRLAEEEVLLVQREEAERALQKEKEKREKEVQKKEAQQRVLELSQKLVEGIVNTALGVTAALKYGFPLGPVFAAIIGAMGAVQTAIIAKQIAKAKSQMEHGGKVGEQGVSRSHKQGGHRIEDTNIEVEGGEWVINRKSSKKYDSLLKSINDDNVGLVRKQIEIIREKRIVNNTNQIAKFASGGQINTLTATNAVRENNEIAAISELIKAIDFQPTVSVVDINKVNKRLVRVQDLSGKAV